MCGIVGIVAPALDGDTQRAIVERMLASIEYRGPDSSGIAQSGGATFGCNRLAIVDVANGMQPLVSAEDAMFVLNGEIFNYQYLEEFDGIRGDTSTLFRRVDHRKDWDQGIEGQFALAHVNNRILTLARDRNGVLPLYYRVDGHSIWFASEERALFAGGVTKQLDPGKAFTAEVLWGAPPDESVWQGIKQVPPGSSVEFDLLTGNLEVNRASHKPSMANGSGAFQQRSLLESLRDAVSLRVPLEVDYGVLLSGGLDSSIIAALAADGPRKPLAAYAIGFEGKEFDESPFQERMADVLNVRLVRICPTVDQLASAFIETVQHVGQPLIRTAPIATLLLGRRIREDGIKVVLSGEGADEYFGGYELFKVTKMRSSWDGDLDDQALRFLQHLEELPGEHRTIEPAYYQRHLGTHDSDPFFSHRIRWTTTAAALNGYVISAGAYEFSVEAAITLLKGNLPAGFSDRPLLERTRTLEIKTLLHSALLGSQSDRVLMASGVEGRYPFLDSSVVSFGERCEWDDLFDGDWSEKRSLREAVTGLLPDEIRIRPKQAYAAPTSALLRSTAGIAIFEDLLSTLDGVALDWIQPGALLWLVARLKDGRPLSTYDEIAILWFASLAVLI